MQSKIDISSSISSYHESQGYQKKISAFKASIEKSRAKGSNLEAFLNEQNTKFSRMYE